ncbi:MAG: hypothetical protein IPM81_17120 [Saprospirales bacterium]|nr:hypothetical protein [Saprospirales bacterium]
MPFRRNCRIRQNQRPNVIVPRMVDDHLNDQRHIIFPRIFRFERVQTLGSSRVICQPFYLLGYKSKVFRQAFDPFKYLRIGYQKLKLRRRQIMLHGEGKEL